MLLSVASKPQVTLVGVYEMRPKRRMDFVRLYSCVIWNVCTKPSVAKLCMRR